MDHTIPDSSIIAAVAKSTSLAGALRLLERAEVGSNYRIIRLAVERLSLDTSHWKTGPQLRASSSSELLVANNQRPRMLVKKVILREKLLPYVCETCGLGPEWNGRPLVLRLDHRNGIRNDDRLENLRFLCPNCDSQTETFCGRNRSDHGKGATSKKLRPCAECGEGLTHRRLCRRCASKARHVKSPVPTKIAWPPIEELQARLAGSSFVALASELGVSDNAIRKHLRTHARVAEGGGF